MEQPILNGQCRCELATAEAEVLRCVFESVLESGKAPTTIDIGASLSKSEQEIIHALDALEAKDLLLRKKGTQDVVSLYPFSLTPTEHRLFLDRGRKLFAMCAVDSLGMPIMFDRDVRIISQCENCKQEIMIEVKSEEIASRSHSGIMIWSPKSRQPRPAETCCPMVNFFCSKKHLAEWEKKNPDLARTGQGTELREAFPRIRECWKSYGELVGVR